MNAKNILNTMCQMDAEIKTLLASLGSCSRLKHTPIPLAYVIHLRTFLVSAPPMPQVRGSIRC